MRHASTNRQRQTDGYTGRQTDGRPVFFGQIREFLGPIEDGLQLGGVVEGIILELLEVQDAGIVDSHVCHVFLDDDPQLVVARAHRRRHLARNERLNEWMNE